MSMKKNTLPKSPKSARAKDQPATRTMLSLVRDELKSDIRGLDRKMDARFGELDAKFGHIDARFGQIDARFLEMNARFEDINAKFSGVEGRFEGLDGRLARMELLLEEQNANNHIVLEGLQSLFIRQERLEQRFT